MPNIHHLLSPLTIQCLPNYSITTTNVLPSAVAVPKADWEERKKEGDKKKNRRRIKKRYLKQSPESKDNLKGGLNVNASWPKEEIAQIMPQSHPLSTQTYQQENTVARPS